MGLALIKRVIPAMQVEVVMILEAIIECFEEPVDCDRGLVRRVGEHERIGVVGHIGEIGRLAVTDGDMRLSAALARAMTSASNVESQCAS